MTMLRFRHTPHIKALCATALIGAFLLAFVGVTGAHSVSAQQIPTLNVPGKQMVTVANRTAGTMTFTGHIQVNVFNGPSATALNQATAIGSCTACQTLAVALQVNVISSLTTQVDARDNAIALNKNCPHCLTTSEALQYWIIAPGSSVTIPNDVRALIAQMNHQFAVLEAQPNLTPNDAIAAINGVLSQFASLLDNLTIRLAQTTQMTSPGQ